MKERLEYKIEIASVSDAEEILSLQKLAYVSEAEIYNDFSIPPLLQTLEEIRDDFDNQIFLRAVSRGKIIGSVRGYEKDGTCYIGRLIVHPDYQNMGIGTQLMNHIEEFFNQCKRFELFTGYRSEKNIYLYQKCGYRIFKTEDIVGNLKFVYLQKEGQRRRFSMKISKKNAEHYIWGNVCDGWHLIKRDSLSVIHEKMPPKTSEVRHYHEKAGQFFFALSGEATIEVNGETVVLGEHEGIEILPNIPHQMFNNSDNDIEFIVISSPSSKGDRIVVEEVFEP